MAITIKNSTFSGGKIGIQSSIPVNIKGENIRFENVETPFDLASGSSIGLKGTRITDDPKARATPRTAGKSRTGWRKLHGPPLPVFCPKCKSIFPSKNYNFAGAFFNSWDNEETCIECGFEHAKLSEGVFNIIGETINVLNAPDLTHAMLHTIRNISEDVLAGKIDQDTAVKKFEAVNPKFGKFARRLAKRAKSFVYFAAAIAALVGLYLNNQQVNLQREANLSTVQQAILETLSAIHFDLKGARQIPNPESAQEPSDGPSASKSQTETSTSKLKNESKPNNRKPRRKPSKIRRKNSP